MSEEEFLNRLLNKIAKEFGYDAASTLKLMFMTKEKKIEQLENIRKEAVEYVETIQKSENNINPYILHAPTLLNILNKGSEDDVNITN